MRLTLLLLILLGVTLGKLWNKEGCGVTKVCVVRSDCKFGVNPYDGTELMMAGENDIINDECPLGFIARKYENDGAFFIELWSESSESVKLKSILSFDCPPKEALENIRMEKIHNGTDNTTCSASVIKNFFNFKKGDVSVILGNGTAVSGSFDIMGEVDLSEGCPVRVPTFDENCSNTEVDCLPRENLELFDKPAMEYKCSNKSGATLQLFSANDWKNVTFKCDSKKEWIATDEKKGTVSMSQSGFQLRCALFHPSTPSNTEKTAAPPAKQSGNKDSKNSSVEPTGIEIWHFGVAFVVLFCICVFSAVIVVLVRDWREKRRQQKKEREAKRPLIPPTPARRHPRKMEENGDVNDEEEEKDEGDCEAPNEMLQQAEHLYVMSKRKENLADQRVAAAQKIMSYADVQTKKAETEKKQAEIEKKRAEDEKKAAEKKAKMLEQELENIKLQAAGNSTQGEINAAEEKAMKLEQELEILKLQAAEKSTQGEINSAETGWTSTEKNEKKKEMNEEKKE